MIDYSDFDLTISRAGDQYFAQVTDSPDGASEKTALRRPFPDVTLETLLLRLENAILKSQNGHRGSSLARDETDAGSHETQGFMTREEKVLREFGDEMFKIVFREASAISARFAGSVNHVTQKGDDSLGLRVKLRVEPPELAALPWEYLYDELEDNYLCLESKSPLVRFLPVRNSTATFKVNGQLNVLGMVANPDTSEWPWLDAEKERRQIEDAIKPLHDGSQINLKWVKGGTWEDLLDSIQEEHWHVFHFIGHGGTRRYRRSEGVGAGQGIDSEGFVVMEHRDKGRADEIPAATLATLLKVPGSLRLAVLNCCDGARGGDSSVFSSTAATLVRKTVPAVVAMQFRIMDQASIGFARNFYRSLVKGEPIERAITTARLSMNRSLAWGVPVLFTRAKTGMLFSVETADMKAPASLGKGTQTPAGEESRREKARKLMQQYYQ